MSEDGMILTNPDVARGVLESLSWDVDMQIINHEGEHVWLGPCLDETGKRIGITDCCFVGEECGRHV